MYSSIDPDKLPIEVQKPMRLDESVFNKVSLIKNSIKLSMRAIKTEKELMKN